MPLSPKQARFVEEYLVDLNATQAATRTGYSQKTAYSQGQRLLKNVEVARAVKKRRKAASDRLKVSRTRVLTELAKLAFANMADYMKVGPDGAPRLDFSALDRDQTAALQEVTVEEFVVGAGEDEDGNPKFAPVRKVKFKLYDKRATLVDLGKHLGMFVERRELSGKVRVAGSIRIEELTDAQLERLLARITASLAAGN